MRAFGKLLISDLKQFLRDRTALFFTFAFPLLFMLIFGAVFSGNQSIKYNIGLVDNDKSVISSELGNALEKISVFNISQGSQEQKMQELLKGDIRALIVIPEGAQTNISSGNPVNLTVYYDPSQTTSSTVILTALNQATNVINQQITMVPQLLRITQESVLTHELRDIDYLVPGILAMSTMFLGLFGSIAMVERREKKVLKRFGATPISRAMLLYSSVVYRLILAVLQTVIIIVVAKLVFKVNIIGNWALLFGMVILGTLTFISIGYFAVSRAKTVEGAMPIIQLIQFPMLFISGIFFPIEIMPAFMRPIVQAIPLTYLGDSLRQIMVEATPLYPMAVDAGVLAGWLIVCVGLAVWLFRWE